jgi:hypothetical protein
MPYDPRMLQMAQQGVRMMAPEPSPFERNAQQPQRPKQWWEQMPAQGGLGGAQSPQDLSKPDDPNAPKKPQPSLLQLLMLGGQPTYSGTPRPTAPGANPWGWLGSMYGGGGPGGGR